MAEKCIIVIIIINLNVCAQNRCQSSQYEAKMQSTTNGRLRPLCRHLANWTKHTHRLWLRPICCIMWNMTSFINITYCIVVRGTEPWPQVTCREIELRKCTDKYKGRLTAILCSPTSGKVISTLFLMSYICEHYCPFLPFCWATTQNGKG